MSEMLYNAAIVEEKDSSKTIDNAPVTASDDEEAKAKARKWALEVCRSHGVEKARLTLTGGTIRGTWSEPVDWTKLG